MISNILWDAWCIVSIVGIWPRFIEPRLIETTYLNLAIPNLPDQFSGFKILQISDLHINPQTPKNFLKHLTKKIKELSPDLIVFTGDFICYSKVDEAERLKRFLSSLQAPMGCFAIPGNHDYCKFVSIDEMGQYSIIEKNPTAVVKGLKRLFSRNSITLISKPKNLNLTINENLQEIMTSTHFRFLTNETVQIARGGAILNLTGVGEYMMGDCLPEKAFKNFKKGAPGVILAHNPDCIPLLENYPGELILCGHTHGGQINLPCLRDKFIMIENPQYSRGLNKANGKWIYTSRGLGGVMPFRWFCRPEICFITLGRTYEK